ncbi:MAG TPA: cytochrome P450 [Actinomycetota bacterium]|nr:cytochrome P450 [Actinomycetota bacterium]
MSDPAEALTALAGSMGELDLGPEDVDITQPGVAELALFSPMMPKVRANPWPIYHRLREQDPVHFSDFGTCLLTRYDDAVAVLRDKRFSVEHRNYLEDRPLNTLGEGFGPAPSERDMSNVMLFVDPPRHTRLRTLVNKAFTPRVVEKLRGRVQEVVDELLDAVEDKGEMDVIEDFSYPLPVKVICEMLGVPQEDTKNIRVWSRQIAPILDPIVTDEAQAGIEEAESHLQPYWDGLIEDRRNDLRDDLLSELIRAEDEGHRLNHEELRSTCNLILIAGHETTMNLIGNGLLALLRNRDQLEKLQENPGLARSAVEELLRFDSPVHLTARSASEELEVGGSKLPRGQLAIIAIGGVNRDPAYFPDPDRLDIERDPNHHIAFSAGAHYCVGATLARLEAAIAFPRLLERLPKIDLAVESPEYRETITLRGLAELPVTF